MQSIHFVFCFSQYLLHRAGKINLSGYTTATDFSALQASFNNLTTGVGTAQALGAYNISAYTDLTFSGRSVSWLSKSVVTSLNTTRVTIRDHDNDAVSFTALSPNGAANTATIFYLGSVYS